MISVLGVYQEVVVSRRVLLGLLAVALLGAWRIGAADPAAKPVAANAARQVADGVVADVIAERYKELFARMERVFQLGTSETALPSILEPVLTYGGKPLEAEFKAADEGEKLYPDGTRRPMLKLWYAVRTTKSEKGTYFMFVEVVPEESGLACSAFSIVSFVGSVPHHLQ